MLEQIKINKFQKINKQKRQTKLKVFKMEYLRKEEEEIEVQEYIYDHKYCMLNYLSQKSF